MGEEDNPDFVSANQEGQRLPWLNGIQDIVISIDYAYVQRGR